MTSYCAAGEIFCMTYRDGQFVGGFPSQKEMWKRRMGGQMRRGGSARLFRGEGRVEMVEVNRISQKGEGGLK